jgi:hypothetical protein
METDATLKYTPIDSIAPTVERLRKSFNSHKTKSKDWRITNLLALKKACLDNKDQIIKAVQKDLSQDLLFATNEAIGENFISFFGSLSSPKAFLFIRSG